MKTIALMPVKNEEWILETTLQSLSKIADHIIVADQDSTDRTREILDTNEKVIVIDNKVGENESFDIGRLYLLEEARKRFGTDNNLIVYTDADEMFPPNLFLKLKKKIYASNGSLITPGKAWVSFPWVQLWRSVHTFRNDSSDWSPATNRKPCMFVDDGTMQYDLEKVRKYHTSRLPGNPDTKIIESNVPLLHFQFANWKRTQEKQAWYRCKEFVRNGVGSKTESMINQKYRITKDESNIRYSVVPKIWFEGVNVPTSLENNTSWYSGNGVINTESWYVKEINAMLAEHGKEAFAKLDIWDVVQ